MNAVKLFLFLITAALLGAVLAIGGYKLFEEPQQPQATEMQREPMEAMLSRFEAAKKELAEAKTDSVQQVTAFYQAQMARRVPEAINFTDAAESATMAVVHIKAKYNGRASQFGKKSLEDMFQDLFGDEAPKQDYHDNFGHQMSSGSGVIITEDGHVATNFHVIDKASSLEVVMNDRRSYKAEVIGTDPTTDLALLKIDADETFPFIPFGDSDQVKVGQWVLAVGNPFDLTSTVTAGIVSAKTRNINILNRADNLSIESFIQTDAAVNPGNSGGALVDLKGELIGINTAIATRTGSYSGYSFAIPSTLAKKVMEDLLSYGEVQRALMGVSILDVDAQLARDRSLNAVEGVYILGVSPGGGAADAGIRAGDVVVAIDGHKIHNTAELQEWVARNRPGDVITVHIKRKSEDKKILVLLKNKMNTTDIVEKELAEEPVKERLFDLLGARLNPVKGFEKENLSLPHGLKVELLYDGLLKESGVEDGFIITFVDKKKIADLGDLWAVLKDRKDGVLIEGIYPDGRKDFYALDVSKKP